MAELTKSKSDICPAADAGPLFLPAPGLEPPRPEGFLPAERPFPTAASGDEAGGAAASPPVSQFSPAGAWSGRPSSGTESANCRSVVPMPGTGIG